MSVPKTHIQERLSIAYLSAVTAQAGLKLLGVEGREYGIDGYIQMVKILPNGVLGESGPLLQFQMKSTTQAILNGQYIKYKMEIDAYNKLVAMQNDGTPCILMVYRMPSDVNNWIDIDEDNLIMRNCCYWQYINDPPSSNESKITVSIPRNQIVTPDSLKFLLTQLREKGAFY